MKTSKNKILKWIGLTVGAIVLVLGGIGLYIYSLIPKAIGTPTVLQASLFQKPEHLLPLNDTLLYRSAVELAYMIKSKKITSVDLVTTYINQIKNNNYKYSALIWSRFSEALDEAKQADEAIARGDSIGSLHGVPITIKEMFWVKGSPSTLNAKAYGFTAPDDGVVVKQLKKAGAVVLGTTNVPYMLSDYQTFGEVYPRGKNPYDTSRTPGGSTGGGAAALAAGFTTLELGSDMGGSIRIPAAFCGLYGLKPTFGVVNITQGTGPDTTTRYDRMALASGGPLARTPEDIELMWNVIKETPIDKRFQKKFNDLPAQKKSISDYKIAWVDHWKSAYSNHEVSTEIKNKIATLIDSLHHHAYTHDTVPDLYDAMTRSFLSTFASLNMDGQPWIIRKLFGMSVSSTLGKGFKNFDAFMESLDDVSDPAWDKIELQRKKIIDQWESFFNSYDIFICPITYGPAFKHSPTGSELEYHGSNIGYMDYVGYSYIFNATGHPCMTIPMGLDQDGLPLAIQIVGKYHSENELIQFAKLIRSYGSGFVKPKQIDH